MSVPFVRPLAGAILASAMLGCSEDLPLDPQVVDEGPQLSHAVGHAMTPVNVNNYSLELWPTEIGFGTYKGEVVHFRGGVAYGTDAGHVYYMDGRGRTASFESAGVPALVETGGSHADHYTSALMLESDDQRGGQRLPLNLVTVRESFAFASAPDDDYVILRYTMANPTDEDIDGAHLGFIADPDVGKPWENGARFHSLINGAYVYDEGLEHISATTLLNAAVVGFQGWTSFGRNVPESSITPSTNAAWFQALSASTIDPEFGYHDVLTALATAPVTIPAGGSVSLTLALVGGESLSDVDANVAAAQARHAAMAVPAPTVHPIRVAMRTEGASVNATLTFPSASTANAFVVSSAACGQAPVTVTSTGRSTVSVAFAAPEPDSNATAGERLYCAGRLADGSYFAGIGVDAIASAYDLAGSVQSLVDAGLLQGAGGAMLIASLEDVATKLENGQIGAALNKVNSYINQVNALIHSRRISEIDGQELVDGGMELADQISG